MREPVEPETATPKVRGPVSGVVFSCHPVLFDKAMICPSSAGLAVGKTQASNDRLPVVWRAAGKPRSTKLEVPSLGQLVGYAEVGGGGDATDHGGGGTGRRGEAARRSRRGGVGDGLAGGIRVEAQIASSVGGADTIRVAAGRKIQVGVVDRG